MTNLKQPTPDVWYRRPDCLKIALQPGEAELSFFDHDTIITKEISGETFDAMVPTHTMERDGNDFISVPAAYAGNTPDGMVILYLPTSNNGRPTWVFPEKYLADILIKQPETGFGTPVPPQGDPVMLLSDG